MGADGLHSNVRRLTFGAESSFEKFLGYSVAAFEAIGYPQREDDVYVNYSTPGKQVGRLSLRNDRTLFLFVFADERGDLIDADDTESKRKCLRAQFGDLGWECPQILAAMESCEELYFDRVSQIRMNTWSKGRVGLIGDAAFCPSLLAGQGCALAMIAAYVLAGELGRSRNSPENALLRYQERLRDFMLAKQIAAEKFATSFTPKTRWGLLCAIRSSRHLRSHLSQKWCWAEPCSIALICPITPPRRSPSVDGKARSSVWPFSFLLVGAAVFGIVLGFRFAACTHHGVSTGDRHPRYGLWARDRAIDTWPTVRQINATLL